MSLHKLFLFNFVSLSMPSPFSISAVLASHMRHGFSYGDFPFHPSLAGVDGGLGVNPGVGASAPRTLTVVLTIACA